MAASLGDSIYVFGGSRNDDSAVIGPTGPAREYFNDVWRTTDGSNWELVTDAASWSPRPGHQCESLTSEIVCFGGFGQGENPTDIWASPDGAEWRVGGHEILPIGGHETARWWPIVLPTGGQWFCPR